MGLSAPFTAPLSTSGNGDMWVLNVTLPAATIDIHPRFLRGKNLLAGSKEGMKISTAEFLEGPLRPPGLVEFAFRIIHIDIYMWRCDIINHDGIERSPVSDL
jgi:hypothetical protein